MTPETEQTRVKNRRPGAAWIAAVLLATLVGYVGTYLLLGESEWSDAVSGIIETPEGVQHLSTPATMYRTFRRPLDATLFIPAAWVEAKICRYEVSLSGERGKGVPGAFHIQHRYQAVP